MSIEEQISNLKEIGLTIPDEAYAARVLNDISYFRLIKAYSIGLKPKNGFYNDGITFDQIVQLYLFNANFRHLLFSEIEQIEVNMRCRISNYFSKRYGILGYRDPHNFENEYFHSELLNDIDKEVQRNSKAPFIKNFRENYDPPDIPLYAAIEVFSFGSLSKFFKNMKAEDKRNIAKQYGVKYIFLESWMESLSYVRNVCAHYGRLYNATLTKTPRLLDCYRKSSISNNRIFASLCCMNHLLPHDDHWVSFLDDIENMFQKYPAVNRQTMGFPDNWKVILK